MPDDNGSRSEDPLVSFNFTLEVEGATIGYFTDVSGLGVEIEVETVKEGGQNQFEHKLPGLMKWSNITLKRGITSSKELFKWIQKTSGDGLAGAGNTLKRTTGKISMLDTQANPIQTWTFDGAFPVKWTGPTMAANSSDVASEELEIAHDGFRVE